MLLTVTIPRIEGLDSLVRPSLSDIVNISLDKPSNPYTIITTGQTGSLTPNPLPIWAQPLGAIGPVIFLLDAITGMTGDGTHLTSLIDLSGNNYPCTIPVPPQFSATGWMAALPAARFIHSLGHYCTINLPAIAQPFTLVSVIDGYCGGSDIDNNNGNLLNAGPVAYRASGGSKWSIYAGTPTDSTIAYAASLDAYVRFDIFNGNASAVYRSGTGSVGLNPGNSGIVAGVAGIGAPGTGGSDTMECVAFAGMCLFGKVLSSTDMSTVLAFYTSRYPGIVQL